MYYLLGYRLMELPIEVDRKEVRAQNTYILTLDGDIDFRPSAVRILVDRMKVNRDLGSVCGRIHPLGSGKQFLSKFRYNIHEVRRPPTQPVRRSDGLVPEVRVRGRPLAAKIYRARDRLRALQSGLLRSVPRPGAHGLQRDAQVCYEARRGAPLHPVRPGRG